VWLQKLIASGLTKDKINAIKLLPAERKLLDAVRKVFDEEYAPVADVMRRVYNQGVEKVNNYVPFMADWRAMDEVELFQRFAGTSSDAARNKANVDLRFTKKRVGGEVAIDLNIMDIFMKHTDNTSYLIEMGELSKSLGKVAGSKQMGEGVGEIGQRLLLDWVDVIARKGGGTSAAATPALDTLRRNVGAGILGLKLGTVLIQPTAFIDGMGFIGPKYAMMGASDFAKSPQWRKFVFDMPEIKDRLGGEAFLRELTDKNWLQRAQKKGFIPLQVLDQYTAGAVAAGAYRRKMVELGRKIDFAKVDKEALAYAQLAVRRTQSSGAFKDVPLAISRGALTGNRSVDRAILQFQNFLLTRWSRIRHDAVRVGINTQDPSNAIAIFTTIAFASLAASGMRLGANRTIDFITGSEDKDSIAEDIQKGWFYEMTGNVPFVGTIASVAIYTPHHISDRSILLIKDLTNCIKKFSFRWQ